MQMLKERKNTTMRAIDMDEIVRIVKNQRAKLFRKEDVNLIKQIILSFVNEAHILNVQPVIYAHWTLHKDGTATCSNCSRTCGSWDYDDFDRFCRCCGATMSLKEK